MKNKLIIAAGAAILLLLPLQTAIAGANVIEARKDEPIQITWFIHRTLPYVKSHEGLLHADTFSWRCYPVIAQTFRGDKKSLLLGIELDGPGNWSTDSAVIFAIDGDVTKIRLGMNNVKGFTTLNSNHGAKITLHDQESLITKISTARDVWVTIPDGNSGVRHSVKLSDAQLQIFQEMIERYHSLEPKP